MIPEKPAVDLQIQEIAAQCGFFSPDAFANAFCRRYGCPPAKFREQQCPTYTGKPHSFAFRCKIG